MKTKRLSEEWQRLRDTDLQALDLKEAATWPLLLRAMTLLLVFILALALVYWLVIKERTESLSAAEREETVLLTEFRQKALEATYLPEIEQQLADMDTQMQQLRAMLPTNAEIPSLLDSISDAALDNRLSVETIRLQETTRQTHYTEHPFDIEVQGGYHDIAQFVADIAALPRIVTQHDFELAPVESDKQTLRLAIIAQTYSDRPQGDDTANDSDEGGG
ncbi:type 4a pilus biogenesis protein PilO [Vreelandella aquamarina]|uniref:type 4a pilus biogenesis protein PilO n=1 Tax=Vreelandella aquamarina TaxID=77097 RepID=UPI00384CCB7E